MEYKSTRIVEIGKKPRNVILGENGKIINRNPSKEELIGLKRFPEKDGRSKPRPWTKYTEEYLLNELRKFEKDNGRTPTAEDFSNNPEYPSIVPYKERFGTWLNSLKLAGLNVDLMGHQCKIYRGRQIEISILDYLNNKPIDLSGENCHSYCDAIDPIDGHYDVKSSKLVKGRKCYDFHTDNKDKDDDKEAIRWYYLVALNDDNSVKYVWKVPGEIVDEDHFLVGNRTKYTIDDMEEYNITKEFKEFQKKRIDL